MVKEYLEEYYIPALQDLTALNGNVTP